MWSWETVETRYNNICRKSIFISDILASLDELFTLRSFTSMCETEKFGLLALRKPETRLKINFSANRDYATFRSSSIQKVVIFLSIFPLFKSISNDVVIRAVSREFPRNSRKISFPDVPGNFREIFVYCGGTNSSISKKF